MLLLFQIILFSQAPKTHTYTKMETFCCSSVCESFALSFNATWKVAFLLCKFPYLEKGYQVNEFLFEALSFLLLFFFALLQIQSRFLFILFYFIYDWIQSSDLAIWCICTLIQFSTLHTY